MVASIIFPALIPAGVSGYTIENAIWFDGSADYLTQNFASDGDLRAYVISCWFKTPGTESGDRTLICGQGTSNQSGGLRLENGYFDFFESGGADILRTTREFRDPTAWTHVVAIWDSDNSTEADRMRLWFNGVRETAFAAATSLPLVNENSHFATNNNPHTVGKDPTSAGFFWDGYIAEMVYLDGPSNIATIDASSFGESDNNGVWVPVDPSGLTFGNNGFYSNFSNANALGLDVSRGATIDDFGVEHLMHFDTDVDGITSSTDSGLSAATLTFTDNAQLDTSVKKIGTASLLLDGSGDEVSFTGPVFGTNNYTIDFWIYPLSSSHNNAAIISNRAGSGNDCLVIYFKSGYSNRVAMDTPYSNIHLGSSSTELSINTWHHVAFTYDGTSNRQFIDGTLVDTTSTSFDLNRVETWRIGQDGSGNKPNDLNGHIDELRMVNGVCKWTSSFTPETSAYSTPTANNSFQAVSIATTQQVTDTPSDDADNNIGNYATLNPLDLASSTVLSNGNLRVTSGSNYFDNNHAFSTIAMSTGKFYFTSLPSGTGKYIGIANASVAHDIATANDVVIHWDGSAPQMAFWNGSSNNLTPSPTEVRGTDQLGIALNATNGEYWIGWYDISGSAWYWYNSSASNWTGNPDSDSGKSGTLSGGPYRFFAGCDASGTHDVDFGQASLWGNITELTNFKQLNTANLPAPTVTDPSDYFNTVLYTGNGSTLAVPGVGFQPDFVWIKCRDEATNWNVMDVVREDVDGTPSMLRMASSNNGDAANEFDSFDADGFSVTHSAVIEELNRSSATYVAFCMKAGGSPTTTSPAGTIASSTSVADHGGFSIGTFTVNTSGAFTVGHGLTRDIGMLWIKDRDANSGYWVWSDQLGATTNYLNIYTNLATYTDGATNIWNGVHPGASSPSTAVFSSTGTWLTDTNDHVFYAFARTPGLIAMGSFTGANATDGSYIVLDDDAAGFKPAWFMFKNLGGNGDWYTFDSTRNVFNPVNNLLSLNQTKTESTMATDSSNGTIDFTANGVKFRSTNGSDFQGASTFVYLAFAENPFGGDGVAQAKAR